MGAAILSIDIKYRMSIVLFLLFLLIWWPGGKLITWIASLLPYLLRRLFGIVYRAVEGIVCWLHKRMGAVFYKLDNSMAAAGETADHFLEMWYLRWHCRKRRDSFVFGIVCLILAYRTFLPHPSDQKIVDSFYARQESKVIGWLEKHGRHEQEAAETSGEIEAADGRYAGSVIFTVATSKDPLTVRDIPSVENCTVLGRAEKGSTVVWNGSMAFGEGSDGRMEPWARVETEDGVTGWVRMIYLSPQSEEDYELNLLIE